MKPPDRLAHAVETCGYRCMECQSPVIRLDYAPALGWIPVVRHWQVGGEWCPVLSGGVIAQLESVDLLTALARTDEAADYAVGEPVWHRRELAAA